MGSHDIRVASFDSVAPCLLLVCLSNRAATLDIFSTRFVVLSVRNQGSRFYTALKDITNFGMMIRKDARDYCLPLSKQYIQLTSALFMK